MSAEKVYIRPITAADTAKVVAWRNKDFVRKNFIYQKLFTKEGHMAWLREQVEPGHVAQFIICVKQGEARQQENDGETVEFCRQDESEAGRRIAAEGICGKTDDAESGGLQNGEDCRMSVDKTCTEIGSVYLRDIDREKKTAEYGVFIGEEDALGKGYGTQAAKLMLEYGFETLGLERIFLRFVDGNAGARKSYEKAGFRMIENRRETVNLEQGEREIFFMETERSAWKSAKRLGTESV